MGCVCQHIRSRNRCSRRLKDEGIKHEENVSVLVQPRTASKSHFSVAPIFLSALPRGDHRTKFSVSPVRGIDPFLFTARLFQRDEIVHNANEDRKIGATERLERRITGQSILRSPQADGFYLSPSRNALATDVSPWDARSALFGSRKRLCVQLMVLAQGASNAKRSSNSAGSFAG